MSTSEAMAKALVLEVMRDRVDAFVALQYLGLVDQAQLHALFGDELAQPDPVAEILARGVAPVPAYERKRQLVQTMTNEASREPRYPPVRAFKASLAPAGQTGERSLFSRWMENEIPWSPAVMGWADTDGRADGWQDGRYDG